MKKLFAFINVFMIRGEMHASDCVEEVIKVSFYDDDASLCVDTYVDDFYSSEMIVNSGNDEEDGSIIGDGSSTLVVNNGNISVGDELIIDNEDMNIISSDR